MIRICWNSGERKMRPGLNLSQLEEDDSDYESESFNNETNTKPVKFGEPVIMVRRQSLPKKKWMRSSDSESAEDQYCTNSDSRYANFPPTVYCATMLKDLP